MKITAKRLKKHNGEYGTVSYKRLHNWLNEKYKKPDMCVKCGKEKKLDWSLKSDTYTRNINDYEALCRSCHLKKDQIHKDSFVVSCSNIECESTVEVNLYRLKNSKNNYCSKPCYYTHKKTLTRGKRNSNYRHGKYINA